MKRYGGTGLIFLLIGAFFLFQVWPALKQFGGMGLELGQEFPPVILETTDDKAHSIPLGNGNVTVLNVWATWCAPCREELPMLQQLSNDWASKNVNVFLASEEITAKRRVVDYLNSSNIHLTPYFLTSSEGRKLGGIGVVPTTFVIAQDGRLIQRFNRLVTRIELESVLRALRNQ
ncbi:MAG: TlpA family protein disulfide reductase [Gammaproteobacteria bacterium]|nr:TlpA family protein disulfide reductase [Gammaproteobacteria bacterium]